MPTPAWVGMLSAGIARRGDLLKRFLHSFASDNRRIAYAGQRRPPPVRSFDIVGPYTLRVCFDDGSERTIDFQPILAGELYGRLRDLELFNQVRIDPEVETLVWPNGADFDPATLHDWLSQEQAFRELARRWEAVQT